MPKTKPPLRCLHEHLREIRETVFRVALSAYGILGAVESHCEMLEDRFPGSTTALKAVTARYRKEMEQANDHLREL